MIFRRRNKETTFTIIPNYTLKDGTLKPESLGVLCYLLSHRDDWSISARQIANHFSISTGRVNTIADDLSLNGYIRKVRHTDGKGKVTHWDWEVFEEPDREKPDLESPPSGKIATINNINNKTTKVTKTDRNSELLKLKPDYVDEVSWFRWWEYKSPKRMPSKQMINSSLRGIKALREAGHRNFGKVLGLAIDSGWQGVPKPDWNNIKSMLQEDREFDALAEVE